MTVRTTDIDSRKTNGSVILKNIKSVKLWEKLEINEWTFSLFLLLFSLSILLGKLCVNYGDIQQPQNYVKRTIPTVAVFSNASTIFNVPNVTDLSKSIAEKLSVTSEKFVNVSNQYEDVVTNAVMSFSERCGSVIRAASSGLIMMGFTWFIIYMDSIIPGVNPPAPFSFLKKRLPETPKMQINYLIGALNGILLFLYMCL